MRIKITATKKHYLAARRSMRLKADRLTTCLVARAIGEGLGGVKVSCDLSDFEVIGRKTCAMPRAASKLINSFDGRDKSLFGRLPVSFYVSVPKKDLEAARAAKG